MSTQTSVDEARMLCAFIQGGLCIKAHELRDMVKLTSVEQPTDDAGNYLPYFVLQLESGLRIRVGVQPEDDHDA